MIKEDGLLQAHEIFSLNLNADLVVLSSCFSGFGEIDPNEGNLGIYRSFLIAESCVNCRFCSVLKDS